MYGGTGYQAPTKKPKITDGGKAIDTPPLAKTNRFSFRDGSQIVGV